MNKNGNILTYISFAIVGLLLAYNTNFFTPEEIQAGPVKPLDLPALEFNPKGNLSLEINLDNGVFNTKSNMPIANIDVTVNHPTKIVEKGSKNNQLKPKIVYETKTEYLEKVVMFTLPTPALHIPSIKYPKSVEK